MSTDYAKLLATDRQNMSMRSEKADIISDSEPQTLDEHVNNARLASGVTLNWLAGQMLVSTLFIGCLSGERLVDGDFYLVLSRKHTVLSHKQPNVVQALIEVT